uniref:DUF5723 domain-containing protein n=1 Tax=Fervidobacterium thailandense TaxID=1008305 RepID=A0A7C4RWJ3_9BACT
MIRCKQNFVLLFAFLFMFGISIVLASPITYYGFDGNPLLLREDGTGLLRFSLIFDAGLFQNLLTLSNLNALLNEEVVKINKETMSAALGNGISLIVPVGAAIYGNLRISQFNLVPYVALEGGLSVRLPKELSELLFGDTLVETNLEKTMTNSSIGDLKLSAGFNAIFENFLVGLNFFVPLLYSYSEGTYVKVKYHSSAEPSSASLELSTRLSYLSAIDLRNFQETPIERLINLNNAGLNLTLGYGTNRFGIVLKDLTVKPATAGYGFTTGVDVKFEYSATGVELNTTGDTRVIDPVFFQTTGVAISDVPKLSAYYKEDGFFSWGVNGTLALDGRWSVGTYAGLDLSIIKPYYKLSIQNGFFAHTLGLDLNLMLFIMNLSFTLTADSLIPAENSTPGFKLSMDFAAGF